ncbi:Ig-like domain-containing protein [Cellulosimicrobium cellulans]|uniref:Ig-like domain-containing protein n=1 Tax=Cellulosimicrobium cellulans TaxID=1710 RepID=UPI002405A4A3|nr:Ig-like domain-containing protein [Cellulosimicrobium cellulans]MDF9877740.1 hypothetical protein [Cellulosimicrobium cellulans]
MLGLILPASTAAAAEIPDAVTNVFISEDSASISDQVTVNMEWAVPDTAQPGDTFWVQLPDSLRKVGGLTFNLYEDNDPSNPIVATATVVDGRITFTMTDFVLTHDNVRGTAFITADFVRENVNVGETNEFTFETAVDEFTDTVFVDIPTSDLTDPLKYGYWADPVAEDTESVEGALEWRLRSSMGPLAQVVFTDTLGPGHSLDCDDLDLRLLGDYDANGNWGSNVALPADQYEIVECSDAGFEIVVTDVPAEHTVIVRYNSTVTDGTLESYANSATVVEDGESSTHATEIERVTSGGGGTGDLQPSIDIEKWSTIDGFPEGDFDEAPGKRLEAGVDESITFTITNDGNEPLIDVVVTDTTDAGPSIEDIVCTFPDGSTGTTWDGPFAVGDSFDCTATLPGMDPSTDHANTAAVTGIGEGSGREVGDDDPWNGYTPPRPSIDIEKWSTIDGFPEGDFDEAPGKRLEAGVDESITFTITNDGEEPLIDVVVTDTTDAGPSIEDIVCTFPDGSTGTTWDGPFAVGDSFDCTATLPGMDPSTDHANTAAVTGIGEGSGREVGDDDPWNGYTPPQPPGDGGQEPTPAPTVPRLPDTGLGNGPMLVGLATLLLGLGVTLVVARRRWVHQR